MAFTVKASLYRNWENEPIETRRFSIDQEVATSFDYLTQKLAQIFSDLEAKKIQVYYLDSDGDRIRISTDDELTEALEQFDGTVFRIYIKKTENQQGSWGFRHPGFWHPHPGRRGFFHPGQHWGPHHGGQPPVDPDHSEHPPADAHHSEHPPAEPDPQNKPDVPKDGHEDQKPKEEKGPYHPGVICDGCNGSIYGTRYKCCQCPDYDLCGKCEGKGLHNNHDMYTIDEPLGGGFPGRCGGRPGGFWGGHGQFGPFAFNLWTHPGVSCGRGGFWGGPPHCGYGGGSWGCHGGQSSGHCTRNTEGPTGDDMETEQTTQPQPPNPEKNVDDEQ